jgi:hypothetical protein
VLVDVDVLEKHTVAIFQGWSDKAGKQRADIGPEVKGVTEGRNIWPVSPEKGHFLLWIHSLPRLLPGT